MERPFPAYEGTAPFIFVSYSHADEVAVFEEMARLHEAGFPIWFDEGISPGGRWSDELAERIDNCRLFLIYVTPRSVDSPHCLRELSFAQSSHRDVLAVHLEETELPRGLELALSDRQAILKYRLPEADYAEKLLKGVSARFEGAELPRELPRARVRRRSRSWKPIALAVGAAVAIGIGGLFYWWNQTRNSPTPPSPLESAITRSLARAAPASQKQHLAIAVLPFVNMSSDPDNEYFSEGISEEILDALVKTRTIDVIARTSSFQFKDRNENVQDIAAKLNASHILEGSVRRAGNQLRITAQLIDAATGLHILSETFDRKLTNVFALQDEIAGLVVAEIGNHLGAGNVPWSQEQLARAGVVLAERKDVNPEAYDLYLRAVYQLLDVGTVAASDKALGLLDASTRIDPRFAGAWYTIALANWLRFDRSPRDNAPATLAALDKALSLEPAKARALSQKGQVEAYVNLRWHDGESMMRRAVQLAPSDASVRTQLAGLLWDTNRTREALTEAERAYQLDPLSVYVATQYAIKLNGLGRDRDAAEVLDRIDGAAQLAPFAWNVLGLYSQLGNVTQAQKYAGVVKHQYGEDSGMGQWADAMVSFAEDPARMGELAKRMDRLVDDGVYVPRYLYSENFTKELETAVENRWFGVASALLQSSLRNIPGASALRRRMRLQDFDVRDPTLATDEEQADYERRRFKVAPELLDTYTGTYVRDDGWVDRFYLDGGRFMINVPGDHYTGEAIPLAKDYFVLRCCIIYYFRFVKDGEGKFKTINIVRQQPHEFRRTLALQAETLARYAGHFGSKTAPPAEVQVRDGKLMLRRGDKEQELLAMSQEELIVALGGGARLSFDDALDGFVLTEEGEAHQYNRHKEL